MSKHVTVVVPAEYIDDDEISDYLMGREEELYPAFDLDVGQTNDNRLQIDDVIITRVELSKDSVLIEFTVEYSAYYGCSDANFGDMEERALEGKRAGNIFTFEAFEYPEPRDTVDEY